MQFPPHTPNYTMKRCNNCGWFNQDSVLSCDKCGEETFDIADDSAEEALSSSVNDVKDSKVDGEESKDAIESEPAVSLNKFGRSTVSIDSDVPASRSVISSIFQPKKEEESPEEVAVAPSQPTECEKCCYPISGYVEYCPNCGATIKNADMGIVLAKQEDPQPLNKNEEQAKSIAKSSADFRMTMREAVEPAPIVTNDTVYRLIPMDILSEAVIEMRVGDVVVIRGERFKFDK